MIIEQLQRLRDFDCRVSKAGADSSCHEVFRVVPGRIDNYKGIRSAFHSRQYDYLLMCLKTLKYRALFLKHFLCELSVAKRIWYTRL
ncbi:MAG TPA: hypothetical protein DCE14_07865 [Kosmotogaceae bacterium]|nr:hypothetical protein [Kosmotogaceae bacterium]